MRYCESEWICLIAVSSRRSTESKIFYTRMSFSLGKMFFFFSVLDKNYLAIEEAYKIMSRLPTLIQNQKVFVE